MRIETKQQAGLKVDWTNVILYFFLSIFIVFGFAGIWANEFKGQLIATSLFGLFLDFCIIGAI